MNLRTYIDTELKNAKDTTILLSAGSGFFFIGTILEFEQDIVYINAEYERNHKSQLLKLKRKCQESEVNGANSNKTNKIKKDCEQFEKPYVAFLEREVLEVYPRIQGDGIVISIEGIEKGNFWFKEEYENWKEKQRWQKLKRR